MLLDFEEKYLDNEEDEGKEKQSGWWYLKSVNILIKDDW